MAWLRSLFNYFIFTSLFIACCALLMAYQTALLFAVHLPTALYVFVFSGTVCSYNFHWWLTPPQPQGNSYKLRWNINHRRLHFCLALLSLIVAGVAGLALISHWLWLSFTSFFVFLYSAPKIPHPLALRLQKIAIGKTLFLSLSWAHVTASLPLLIARVATGPADWLFILNRFFFIYAICIVFDQRDREDDLKAGIKSLVTFLSDKNVVRLFWVTIALFAGTSAWLLWWLPWLQVLLLAAPGLLLCYLYKPARSTTSDYLYYFVLDGLMALSAPLIILAKFAR